MRRPRNSRTICGGFSMDNRCRSGRLDRSSEPGNLPGAILVFVSMVAGTAISLLMYRDARKQAQIADQKRIEAEQKEQENARLLNQMIESRRLFDLNRFAEANLAFSGNQVLLARDSLNAIANENRCVASGILKRHFEGGLFTLYGHTHGVDGIAVDPTGARIVTGSREGSARVWNAMTGEFLFSLPIERQPGTPRERWAITSVAISGDGRRIVTGSADGSAQVFNAADGKRLVVLSHTKVAKDEVASVATNRDGGRIVVGLHSGMVCVWDLREDGASLQVARDRYVGDGGIGSAHETKDETKSRVYGVAISPDGSRIVTGAQDGKARVWDSNDLKFPLREFAHSLAVRSVAMNADGSFIVTGCFDGRVRIWDVRKAELVRELLGGAQSDNDSRRAENNRGISSSSIGGVALSADDSWVAAGSFDGSVRIWSLRGRRPLVELKGHSERVLSVAFTPDCRRLVTASLDGTARVWDVRFPAGAPELRGHGKGVTGVAISADASRIITASGDGALRVWDRRTGRLFREIKESQSVPIVREDRDITCLAMSGDEQRLVTGSSDGTARVWDVQTGNVLMELKGHNGKVSSVAISQDGSRIVTGSFDKTVRIWDLHPGPQSTIHVEEHPPLEPRSAPVWCVAISKDGARVVAGSEDRMVRVWDAQSQQKVCDWLTPPSPPEGRKEDFSPPEGKKPDDSVGDPLEGVWSVAIGGANNDWVVAGCSPRVAAIWDLRNDADKTVAVRRPKVFSGPRAKMRCISLSNDERRIVTGYDDGSLRIWDSNTSRMLLDLRGHGKSVRAVAISREKPQVVVTGSADGTARVWEPLGDEHLFQLEGDIDSIRFFTIRTDGVLVVAGAMPVHDEKKTFEPVVLAWYAKNGKLSDVSRTLEERTNISPDGYMFVRSGSRVVRVPATLDESGRQRRLWLSRPDPEWHVERQRQLADEKSSRGAALHLALEQRARGLLALENGFVWEGLARIAVASKLTPAPPPLVQLGPAPKDPAQP